jgi:hypothetical protein
MIRETSQVFGRGALPEFASVRYQSGFCKTLDTLSQPRKIRECSRYSFHTLTITLAVIASDGI